jgi:acyl-CoA reductase-like NAD-dependent aldehyde dehydrogenase
MAEYKLLINGELVNSSSGRTIDDIGPATGGPIAQVPQSNLEDVERAVTAAREAYDDGRWSGLPHGARAAALEKLATLIETHIPELAELESQDAGKPIKLARDSDLPFSVDPPPCRYSRQRVQRWSYQHHSPRTGRCRCLACSLELSFHDGGLENWPCSRGWQHCRPQALGRNTPHYAQAG